MTRHIASVTIRDVMTPRPWTVGPDESMGLMLEGNAS